MGTVDSIVLLRSARLSENYRVLAVALDGEQLTGLWGQQLSGGACHEV
jgi:hypothetical protein